MIFTIGLTGVFLSVAGLAFVSLGSTRPTTLGVRNGVLARCPDTPNCVASSGASPGNRMPPITFDGDPEVAMRTLREQIMGMDGASIVSAEDNYTHCEFTTPVFRFVDDVEFLLDREESVIHFRSAARTGYADFGLNRRRMSQIQGKFTQTSTSFAIPAAAF